MSEISAPRNTGQTVAVTMFANDGERPLSKFITIENGSLIKKAAADMVSGTFTALYPENIDTWAYWLTCAHFKQYHAAAYGVNPHATSGLVASQTEIAAGRAQVGAVARTNSNFPYRQGAPGIFFADIDPGPGMEAWRADDYDRLLVMVCPWLDPIRRFYIPSASSEIYDRATGARISPKCGYHMHFVLDDASQAKPIGDAIFMALIDHGHGRIDFAKNGAMLLRTIIDAAVWQGSRLDFPFGAVLDQTLEHRPVPVFKGHKPMLLTMGRGRADLDSWKRSSPIVNKLKSVAKPASEAYGQAWENDRVVQAIAAGVPEDVARKTYAAARGIAQPVLGAEFVLYRPDRTPLTVRDLLANKDACHGMILRDPIEPEYGSGDCAKAFLIGQTDFPTIHSLAHGGHSYRLELPFDMIFPSPAVLPLGAMPNPLAGPTAWDAYVEAKRVVEDGALHIGGVDWNPRPLLDLLAAAAGDKDADPITVADEIGHISVWAGAGRKREIKQYFENQKKKHAATTRSIRRAAAVAAAGDCLKINPLDPLDVNLHRVLNRFALVASGPRGMAVADLLRIGCPGWLEDWSKWQVRHANCYEVQDEKTVRLVDQFLYSKSPDRRVATYMEFDPQQPFGYRETPEAESGLPIGVINIYNPPMHPMVGGDTRIFHWYIEHLIPDPRERSWLMAWLACKVQKPHIIGHACIMVAENDGEQVQGTGRGTLTQIMELLFRPEYVTSKMMADISGERGNGWNDWLKNKLIISIPEIMETGDSFKDRRALYDMLKDVCDPNNNRKGIQERGTSAYDAYIFATLFGATNHSDALLIPKGDRRFVILSNGDRMSAEMAQALSIWRKDPMNIGALYRELMVFDYRLHYDPSGWPIETEAKNHMTDLGENLFDDLKSDFKDFVKDYKIKIVSYDLIERWCENVGRKLRPEQVKLLFRKSMNKLSDEANRVTYMNKRVRVMATVTGWDKKSTVELLEAYTHAKQVIASMQVESLFAGMPPAPPPPQYLSIVPNP